MTRRRMAGVAVAVTAVAVIAGCGGDDSAADATATDAAGPDTGVATPPDIPWLEDGMPPVGVGPCPDGWREVADEGGVMTCDPYPEGGALDCSDGEAHFPGEPGCAVVGSPCPAGDFSDALPADRGVVYVQPGATGDGSSAASPYGSLTAFSIGGLPMETVVALSRGTHTGPVRLARGVALWGACAAGTVLTTSTPSDTEGVVTLLGARGEVRDLTVADSPRAGLWMVGAGVEVTLDGVVVEGTESVAIEAFDSARLTARSVVVRDTRAQTSDGDFGRALGVEIGATAEITRAVFEGNRDVAVFVGDPGTAVALSDVVVRDTRSRAYDLRVGRGLEVVNGASAELTRAVFEANREIAVLVGHEGTALTLSDVVVRDTVSRESDGGDGRGLGVQFGAAAHVTRTVFERNRDLGINANNEGTTVTLADVVVRDTEGEEGDGSSGRGLNVQAGAAVEVTRAIIERNRDVGVFAALAGATVTLTDVVVRDTRSEASNLTGGRGLNVQNGATAVVSRTLLERNGELGVFAGDAGTMVTLSDVIVRDTRSREVDGQIGRGIGVQLGATVEATRAAIDGNRDVGVLASGMGTTVTLSDVAVGDTRAASCAETSCTTASTGLGVGSHSLASVSMSRFDVARAELCGVYLANEGQVDLSDGEVRDSLIGVCLQVDGYDLDRLTGEVRFVDNGLNLDSTNLPVPEPAETLPVASP